MNMFTYSAPQPTPDDAAQAVTFKQLRDRLGDSVDSQLKAGGEQVRNTHLCPLCKDLLECNWSYTNKWQRNVSTTREHSIPQIHVQGYFDCSRRHSPTGDTNQPEQSKT